MNNDITNIDKIKNSPSPTKTKSALVKNNAAFKSNKKAFSPQSSPTTSTKSKDRIDSSISTISENELELYHDNYFNDIEGLQESHDEDDNISLESQDLEYSTSTITTSQSYIDLEVSSTNYIDNNNDIIVQEDKSATSYIEQRNSESKHSNEPQQQPFWNEFDINSSIIDPTKTVVHNFFFTGMDRKDMEEQSDPNVEGDENSNALGVSAEEYKKVETFWRNFDDIVIISLMSQLGVLCRIFSSSMLSRTDSNTFHEGSALFTTLPLNVISCVLLGILCNGMEALKFIKREDGDFRNVQIEGLERRIRRSKDSLVLFMAKREEGDVLQHYQDHYPRQSSLPRKGEGSVLEDSVDFDYTGTSLIGEAISMADATGDASHPDRGHNAVGDVTPVATPMLDSPLRSRFGRRPTRLVTVNRGISSQSAVTIDPAIDSPTLSSHKALPSLQEEEDSLSEPDTIHNHDPLQTLHMISTGWDINTTSTAMSSDLMLGLRVGFCGALSSFSSWNSEMVALLRQGFFGQAVMGYVIGVALPILGYWLGVQIALFIFVLRCRRETRKDERRGGYGIRAPTDDTDAEQQIEDNIPQSPTRLNQQSNHKPSVRAFATAIFIIAIVTEFTSILVFTKLSQMQFALQLLFSPLGVILRWKLNKFNTFFHNFPIGTFSANMLSCLLTGSVGFFLAGNPNPEERLVLQSLISGLGGTLSTLSLFVVQILNGMDAIVLRWDGIVYGMVTIFWGMVIGLVTEQSKNWADNL